jgi:heme/copper-type cytochrome/quinol oxidase subunit 2
MHVSALPHDHIPHIHHKTRLRIKEIVIPVVIVAVFVALIAGTIGFTVGFYAGQTIQSLRQPDTLLNK